MFSISGVHTVPGSLNGFMVRLLLKACLWQLSNSCFHSSVGWCQTPAKTRTTDGRAAREEKEGKWRGLERVWTYWGIPVERTSCVFSCVNTQRKNWDDWDTILALCEGKNEMRYRQCFTTSSKSCSSLQARQQTPAQPLIYTGRGRNYETTSACILNASIRDRERAKEQAQEKGSERIGGCVTVATATSRSNSVGDPPVLLSALCVFPHCTEAVPREHNDNTLVSGLVQTTD